MSVLNNSNAISTGVTAYNLESSLRFRSSASAYLEWTPASAGNRKTWTFSAWVKKEALDVGGAIFSGGTTTGNTGTLVILFNASNQLSISSNVSSFRTTTQAFRDPSAWYHIVVAVDTTQATADNRVKLYVNGSQVTSFDTTNNPTLNDDTGVNNTQAHNIGRRVYSSDLYFDGYITEINHVDGQALTPSDFGETDTTTGVWKPKEYTGTYGTNGFYLPMKETQQATGFNTVLWQGNGTSQSITGVGFSPDLVWYKRRDAAGNNNLYDTVRGATKYLTSNFNIAEVSGVLGVSSFDSDGFTIGNSVDGNASGGSYVGWCWDAGSSTVSNTDGTITSSVRANPATGFSIITYTGVGSATNTDSVGHGLNQAPDIYIVKDRTVAYLWGVRTNLIDGSHDYLVLNATDAKVNSGVTYPTDTVAWLGGSQFDNASGHEYVAYAFHSVAGYSKFGSYTGNGSTSGPTVTTGFTPAFVMMKRTDSTSNWLMFDRTRGADDNLNDNYLYANASGVEGTSSTLGIEITSTGFVLKNAYNDANASGGTYIYMAFADTRDAQFNFDASGNKNNWTANNINSNASSEITYDIMNDVATLTDEDTANFATLNPLASNSVSTLSNANLDVTSSTVNYNERATIELPSSGKWYFESYLNTVDCVMGVMKSSIANNVYMGFTTDAWIFVAVNGNKANGSQVSYDSASVVGQTIGIAMNMDNGELTFYRNGVSLGVAFTIADTSNLVFGVGQSTNSLRTVNANFGQRPFAYTPPTGYKKLNTYNLPDSTIKDGSQYFDVSTWTGNGGTQDISLEFSPDLVWAKDRSAVAIHMLSNTISGPLKSLSSNDTTAEASNDAIRSFNSNGFTTGTWVNTSSNAFVGWSWRGSDSSPVSNTDGTITSTVSANTDSGFSVVTYTGNGTAGSTVGHGLGVTPAMVILKTRSASGEFWFVWHKALTSGYYTWLNSTSATLNTNMALRFGNGTSYVAPTSSLFTVGNLVEVNGSGSTYVAYCFAEVEGFSKFGSYAGNGSSDGNFLYFGFKPKWIMIKNITTSGYGGWVILDTSRNPYNVTNKGLAAESSGAEFTVAYGDVLSNGFKIRIVDNGVNASGQSYIYMAFAENPFKQSLAR